MSTATFKPMSELMRNRLRHALKQNGQLHKCILMDPKDTTFVGMSSEVPEDGAVVAAVASIPSHY